MAKQALLHVAFFFSSAICYASSWQSSGDVELEPTKLLQTQMITKGAHRQSHSNNEASGDEYIEIPETRPMSPEYCSAPAVDAEMEAKIQNDVTVPLEEACDSSRGIVEAEAESPVLARAVAVVLQLLIAAVVLDGARRCGHTKHGRLAPPAGAPAGSACPVAGWELFMDTALKGDEAPCAQLLAAPSWSMTREDAWGCTALHAAAKGGAADAARRLLELGARADDRDVWEETPLHLAARAGQTACCEALLDAGAEIDAINAEDQTPLVVAALAGKEATCRALLDRGATAGGLSDSGLPCLLSELIARDVLLAEVSIGPLRHFDEDGDTQPFDIMGDRAGGGAEQRIDARDAHVIRDASSRPVDVHPGRHVRQRG
eukprot:CAMPEP_0176193352 /NCGR_PEP_ID=MMETSP0121_2-20121125/5441_1 /TAXON_ID=160619 /ORGANISM="Kryptoperidinium foliaceum, Strain CCMP 1326" /LENGTH=374 /DNA_ID=CAMNT_0017532065 /DNA_START=72 /DNA_END=1197 /DNA_ORIENTATION=+